MAAAVFCQLSPRAATFSHFFDHTAMYETPRSHSALSMSATPGRLAELDKKCARLGHSGRFAWGILRRLRRLCAGSGSLLAFGLSVDSGPLDRPTDGPISAAELAYPARSLSLPPPIPLLSPPFLSHELRTTLEG
uniref:Uncharacterized protein n=1 Tax=Plectus sambesii TaxID=2011161 RepID=A0A914VB88_9BILA